jgi:hypothetical protein
LEKSANSLTFSWNSTAITEVIPMAMFVHITSERDGRRVAKGGLKAHYTHDPDIPVAVFAVPVIPNFTLSHQWVRELKRRGQRLMCGVYFRIPDEEQVFVGHYNQPHEWMSAAQAVAYLLKNPDTLGFEVLIPRAIPVREIQRVRTMPHVGWRYFPNAHQHHPCPCPMCLRRGEIKSKRIRKKYD